MGLFEGIKVQSPKKFMMKQIWRLRQSQGMYGLISGSLIVSALYSKFIPFLHGGLLGNIEGAIIIFTFFLAFGYAWDRKFQLWADEQEVIQERNPYAREKFTEKELNLHKITLLSMKIGIEMQKNLIELCDKNDINIENREKTLTQYEKAYKDLKEWIDDGRFPAINAEE